MGTYLKQYAARVFYLDLRSLALFRIGAAALIIVNLIHLWPEIDYFYGPQGLFPQSSYFQLYPSPWQGSLHALSNDMNVFRSLFILQGILALLLLIGYKTKTMTIFSWIMYVSLYRRLPTISYGGDSAMMTFLMWGMFLPLGARFSIDQLKDKALQQLPHKFLSVATVGFIIQLIIIYLVAGFAKFYPVWTQDFTALSLLFKNQEWVKPFGTWLLQFPGLLQWMTLATIALERSSALILLLSTSGAKYRLIAFGMFVVFHIMIFVCMEVGWYSLIMICVWMALLPSSIWSTKPDEVFGKNKDRWQELLAGLIVCFVLVWQSMVLWTLIVNKTPGKLKNFGYSGELGFSQVWSMFSPGVPARLRPLNITFVPTDNSYKPLTVKLTRVDLIQMPVFKRLDNYRWRKFFTNLPKLKGNKKKIYFKGLAHCLQLLWNQGRGELPAMSAIQVRPHA